jgi:hypothetical protein
LVAWGNSYFGNPPQYPQGTNIRTPTLISWDDVQSPGLSAKKFEDVAAPDDASFVVLLTSALLSLYYFIDCIVSDVNLLSILFF